MTKEALVSDYLGAGPGLREACDAPFERRHRRRKLMFNETLRDATLTAEETEFTQILQ